MGKILISILQSQNIIRDEEYYIPSAINPTDLWTGTSILSGHRGYTHQSSSSGKQARLRLLNNIVVTSLSKEQKGSIKRGEPPETETHPSTWSTGRVHLV